MSESASVLLNSVVMDNYFEKRAEEIKAKSADELRKDMEMQAEIFKKKKEAIEAVVQAKTVGVKQSKGVEESLPIAPAYEVGAGYVIHKVAETDTLDGICLRYDVSKDMIRGANEFTGDEIYMKRELIIPKSSKF